MWTKRLIVCGLLASLSLFASPCIGSCSEVTATEDTITISKADWNTLKRSNELQARALTESQQELTAVRKAQKESETALSEAKILLEASQMTSDEMTNLCAALLTELQTQKAENQKLMQELKDVKKDSQTASDAIKRANQYLIDTKKAIEENEAAWQKRETQLERQRLLWQIFSVLAVGGGIALAT